MLLCKATWRSPTRYRFVRRCKDGEASGTEPNKVHRMVNVYMYHKLSAIEEIKDNLLLTWYPTDPFSVLKLKAQTTWCEWQSLPPS